MSNLFRPLVGALALLTSHGFEERMQEQNDPETDWNENCVKAVWKCNLLISVAIV